MNATLGGILRQTAPRVCCSVHKSQSYIGNNEKDVVFYVSRPIIIAQENALMVRHGLIKRQPRMYRTPKRNVRTRYGLPSSCDTSQKGNYKRCSTGVFVTARPVLVNALRDTAVTPSENYDPTHLW